MKSTTLLVLNPVTKTLHIEKTIGTFCGKISTREIIGMELKCMQASCFHTFAFCSDGTYLLQIIIINYKNKNKTS